MSIPSTPHPGQQHAVQMSDKFDAEAQAFLDNEGAGVPENVQAPAVASGAVEAAITRADAHEKCEPETGRDHDLVFKVVGVDGAAVLGFVPPGHQPSCVLKELSADPTVAAAGLMGKRPVLPTLAPFTPPTKARLPWYRRLFHRSARP